MINRKEVLAICRELGYDLSSQNLSYYQTGVMVDLTGDGESGYVYAGFTSVNGLGDWTNSNFVALILRGVRAQSHVFPDLVWDNTTNNFRGKVARSNPKFCVFDSIENPDFVGMSFYGYRFRL